MATAQSLAGLGRYNAWDTVAAAATDSVLVAAVAGKCIRVHSASVQSTTTPGVSVTFNSKGSGAGTAIWPAFGVAATQTSVLQDQSSGWFQTNLGEGLSVTTGAGTTGVGVGVTYSVVS